MSGQAKLGLLPCKQGLAGSKPRQWGHYCCDGAVGEMVMAGERVGVFLHVKYEHRGRHMYTHTHAHTNRGRHTGTCTYTQGPQLRCHKPSTTHLTDGDTEAERSYHTPQGWAEKSGTEQSAGCCGRAVLPWTPAGETVAPREGRASVDTQQ